ncbi:hypothetical protein TorRG33x02_185870 [Trema orientale]|uniref:Uncharacterized protein n=1 Tax=Trema orientale TaxID=63057 RepID=A0A2P5EJ79_TREOI|nr:hypothetical protein TorRG33x02_185870 [Trema orientale]
MITELEDDPLPPRKKSGAVIRELEDDSPLKGKNQIGSQPLVESHFNQPQIPIRNPQNNTTGGDNLGVDTEFHDEAYVQDEAPFIPNEHVFNENGQCNGVFGVEGNGAAAHIDGDSDFEGDIRNIGHGDEGYNGQRVALVFNENIDMANPVFQLGCPFLLYARVMADKVTFKVRKLHSQHDYGLVFNNPRLDSTWLSKKYLSRF